MTSERLPQKVEIRMRMPKIFNPGEKALRPSDAFTVTVKKGDTLSGIAARWFPEDPASGQKSILSANPQIDDKNRIDGGANSTNPHGQGNRLKNRESL